MAWLTNPPRWSAVLPAMAKVAPLVSAVLPPIRANGARAKVRSKSDKLSDQPAWWTRSDAAIERLLPALARVSHLSITLSLRIFAGFK